MKAGAWGQRRTRRRWNGAPQGARRDSMVVRSCGARTKERRARRGAMIRPAHAARPRARTTRDMARAARGARVGDKPNMVREEKSSWHSAGTMAPSSPPTHPCLCGSLRSQGLGSLLRSQLAPLDKYRFRPITTPHPTPHNTGTTTGSTHKVEGAEGLGVDTRVEAVAVVADLVDGLGRGDLVGLELAGYRGGEQGAW